MHQGVQGPAAQTTRTGTEMETETLMPSGSQA